jgi:hypothetical protein
MRGIGHRHERWGGMRWTRCESAEVRWFAMTGASARLALVADRAEVLVDAKYDQDEFRGDA